MCWSTLVRPPTLGLVDNGADPAHAVAAEEFGGDPVCWLNRVCQECGRFATDEDLEAAPRCPECGAELPS
jgi:hypothetical protein